MGVYSTYMHLQTLLEEKKKLDALITQAREKLSQMIPENGESDGIRHVVTTRRNVKWSEACRRIIDLIVADSKKGKAWVIVEQLTNDGTVHSYQPSSQQLIVERDEEVTA